MNRRGIIVIAVVLVLVGGAITAYFLLPKRYQTSQHLSQTVAFWNDSEAFLFLSTTTTGRATNAIQQKLTTSKYGFWLMLIDPPASFYKQEMTAYHLQSSGTVDRLTLPEETAPYGRWKLQDGNLAFIPPMDSRRGKLNGFRWDGQRFVPTAGQNNLAAPATRGPILTADDGAEEEQDDSGFLGKAERANFKKAGWHYKLLPTYGGETNEATLPLQLDGNTFSVTVHSFPLSPQPAANYDAMTIGARTIELAGDKLAEPAMVLWNQQGWKEISRNEYEFQSQRFGRPRVRSAGVLIWLLIVLLALVWKFAAWGRVLFAFAGMKKKILKNMATSYSFPAAIPAQFPLLDTPALDAYTRDLESMGFTRLMDFSLTADRGNRAPNFCRLFANDRYHCFAEVHQHFPSGKKPMALKCSLLGILQDGWTLSFSDRKPQAASSLIRRKRALGICTPDVSLRDLHQSFLKMRDQICMDLGISPLTDDTLEAYFRQSQRALGEMREAVQQKSFTIGVPQVYLRKLSLLKTKPEYVWLGDYPKEAEQRKQGYAVPVGAH